MNVIRYKMYGQSILRTLEPFYTNKKIHLYKLFESFSNVPSLAPYNWFNVSNLSSFELAYITTNANHNRRHPRPERRRFDILPTTSTYAFSHMDNWNISWAKRSCCTKNRMYVVQRTKFENIIILHHVLSVLISKQP